MNGYSTGRDMSLQHKSSEDQAQAFKNLVCGFDFPTNLTPET